jgi:hypothetical protein
MAARNLPRRSSAKKKICSHESVFFCCLNRQYLGSYHEAYSIMAGYFYLDYWRLIEGQRASSSDTDIDVFSRSQITPNKGSHLYPMPCLLFPTFLSSCPSVPYHLLSISPWLTLSPPPSKNCLKLTLHGHTASQK